MRKLGSRSSSTRSGSLDTIRNGSRNSQTAPKATIDARQQQNEPGARDPDHPRQQQDDEALDQPQQRPKRQEQQQGLLQVALEIGRLAAALGQQAERHAHQGVERRLNGAQVNGTARQQEEG